MVEEFPAHDGLPEDIQRGSGLAIGVGPELEHGLRIGHDGGYALHVALHVVHDLVGGSAAGRILGIPFLLGQVLEERVQSLVHPRPLPLVRIDDHGEVVVPDFVDDHADHAVLRPLAVGAVRFRPAAVKADHRVFHADAVRVHGNRRGIGIVKGVLRIDVHRMGDHLRGIPFPQGVAFLGIEGHGHDVLGSGHDAHGVPDEFAGTGEGEVTNVISVENPGLLLGRAALLRFNGLRFGHDHNGLVRRPGPLETRLLLVGQHVLRVLEHAGRRNDMVGRHGNADLVVAEGQGEFAPAEELLVLPAFDLVIHRHAREVLCDGIEVVVVFLEILETGTAADLHTVVYVIPPFDLEREGPPGTERLGDVHAHHRIVDGMGQRVVAPVPHPLDLETAVEVVQQPAQLGKAHLPRDPASSDLARVRVLCPYVLVELHPEVGQFVGRVVVVGDDLGTVETLRLIVELDLHLVVRLVLPVLVSRRAGSRPVHIRRRGFLLDLAELAPVDRFRALLGHHGG